MEIDSKMQELLDKGLLCLKGKYSSVVIRKSVSGYRIEITSPEKDAVRTDYILTDKEGAIKYLKQMSGYSIVDLSEAKNIKPLSRW